MLHRAATRARAALRPHIRVPARCLAAPARKTPAQNAADVRDLLRTRLALTEAELDRTERHRALGARATVEPKLDWLQQRLDLDAAQLGKLVRRDPTVLRRSVEESLAPKLEYLQTRLDLDAAQLAKIVRVFPQLLRYSVANVELTLEWLQTRLGLDAAQLKMVVTHPSLLGRSVESMEWNRDWLQRRLDLDEAELRRVVLGRPPLLYYSVEDNMAPTLDWMQARLELDDAQLKTMVLRIPQLLGYSVEDNMAPKLKWLQARLGLDEDQLKHMVLRLPSLLSYSIDLNVAPKLAYLEREIGSEFRDHVVRIPAILGYSLDRHRRRVEACRERGVDAAYALTSAPSTDAKFHALLAKKTTVVVATAASRARRPFRNVVRRFATSDTPVPSDDAAAGGGLPGTEHGGRRLAIVFTCTVCDTRSAKKFSEQAYKEGVVVVRCPGCQNDHLIADNLSFFEDDWTLEDALQARGNSVDKLDDDNLLAGVDPDTLKRLVEGRRDTE